VSTPAARYTRRSEEGNILVVCDYIVRYQTVAMGQALVGFSDLPAIHAATISKEKGLATSEASAESVPSLFAK
jgi:hypothetical protein